MAMLAICEIWPIRSAEFRKWTLQLLRPAPENSEIPATQLRCERGPRFADGFSVTLKTIFTWEGTLVTLDKTPPGATVRIVSLESSDTVTLRLMEMGMVPGSAVRVVKSAPLGDPIQICVRDYHLALRRNEARAITVDTCD